MKCVDPTPATPGRPANAQKHNGIVWPTLCQDGATEAVFFGIGDWGGMCGLGGAKCEKGKVNKDCFYNYGKDALPGMPCTFPLKGRVQDKEIEANVQITIGKRMAERNTALKKAGTPPQFVLNVGDSFYPGGIDVHCGSNNVEDQTKNQFEMVWKQVYPGELTEKLEWWGVLGNHDYGGMCYVKGWDQQVLYTWDSTKWVMPGQYWMRSVQYKNMKMDIFFVDGSWKDTKDGGGGAGPTGFKHNICQGEEAKTATGILVCKKPGPLPGYGPGGDTCGDTGPSSGGQCEDWFQTLWDAEYKWLMDKVPNSDADWQIVVTHYPGHEALGHAGKGYVDWMTWGPLMGIDLIITGHKHYQRIYKGQFPPEIGNWDKGTVSVITGGGGGITSDNPGRISRDGHDDSYGFMEFHATLHEINITTYSHGGIHGAMIARNSTIVTPVTKKPDDEIIKAGLDPLNLLKRREISV
jgi:hypothetical protein